MRTARLAGVAGLTLLVAGCAVTRVDHDNAQRRSLRPAAEAGDAEAQFALGQAYCCGDDGFYSTAEATYWWCRAAAGGHAEAQARLDQLNKSGKLGPLEPTTSGSKPGARVPTASGSKPGTCAPAASGD